MWLVADGGELVWDSRLSAMPPMDMTIKACNVSIWEGQPRAWSWQYRSAPIHVAIVLTLRHAWLDMVWAQVSVVPCELLQTDGQEERKGDDDEYSTASRLAKKTGQNSYCLRAHVAIRCSLTPLRRLNKQLFLPAILPLGWLQREWHLNPSASFFLLCHAASTVSSVYVYLTVSY